MDDYLYSDAATVDGHPMNCACCMTWSPAAVAVEVPFTYSESIVGPATWSDPLAIGAPPTPDLLGAPHEAIAWSDPLAIGAPPTPDLLGAPHEGYIDLSGVGNFNNQSVVPLGQPQTGMVELPQSVIPSGQPQEGVIDLNSVGAFPNLGVDTGQFATGSVDMPQSVLPPGQFATGSVDMPQSVLPPGQAPMALINYSGIGVPEGLSATGARPGVAQIEISRMNLVDVQRSLANWATPATTIGGRDWGSTNAALTLLNLHGRR
jgi:hypothetical protein